MKRLREFLTFRTEDFLKDKKLIVTGCRPWLDNETKAKKGTRVDVVILEDNTKYVPKDGETVSNRFEKLSLKVAKEITIPVDTTVKAVNAVGTIYGEYQNQLAITCEDVVVVQGRGNA